MASQGNYTKHIMSLYMLFSKYFKDSGGKNIPKFILQVHHYPDTKTKQEIQQKGNCRPRSLKYIFLKIVKIHYTLLK